ncbi:ATP-dependent DNA helicase [Trichonephila clavata]|uniref:ATP-dependent DNA helicase n=1 Tax=Trichonephila clavata TaxID=2740835 RepID=A0A8X6GQ16_TRICU|nr:ATP-dependent DNA helicase [Trichonephila clavata]
MASTAHKMQGSTVDYAVCIFLGQKLFAAGQAYFALSHVKSLEELLIEELDCSNGTGNVPRNNEALQEMDRTRNYRPPSSS